MSIAPGSRLASYKILEHIGEGGMGVVYRAEDSSLGRDVAIKVLPEDMVESGDRLARFQREAHLLASLNHPNVEAIYAVEEVDGVHFLVLELVPGEDLGDVLRKGPLRVADALQVCLKIAKGLEAPDGGLSRLGGSPGGISLKVLAFSGSGSGMAAMSALV